MPFAKHSSIHFIIIAGEPLSTFRVSRVFTEHMLRVVTVSYMRHCTWAFDRLPACRSCAKGIVRFVVVISTERFPIKDIKTLVREWFLVFEGFTMRNGDFLI